MLDLAGGTGGLARIIAPAVAPAGHVLLTDLSAAMLDEGMAVMRGLGLGNVTAVTADMAAPPFPPGQFDLVVSQFSPIAEMRGGLGTALAQLRDAGRIALAVWGGGVYGELRLHQRVRDRMGWEPMGRSVTAREVAAKLRRRGMADVLAFEERLEPEWPSVAAYITYRKSFGGPAMPANTRRKFYRVLEEEAGALAGAGGSLRLGWKVGYVRAKKPALSSVAMGDIGRPGERPVLPQAFGEPLEPFE